MEMTEEEYDISKMKSLRYQEIEKARHCKHWGIILGTLGRQGNQKLLDRMKEVFKRKQIEYDVVLLSEITDTTVESKKTADA